MGRKGEYICEWCGDPFTSKRKRKYCSNECQLDALLRTRKASWATRLNDGMRLLSDDFGEHGGDEHVTYQK